MNKIERSLSSHARLLTIVLALVALCMLCPGQASAQWSQPDAGGNIKSTNTGSVGVGTGTSTPNYPLVVGPALQSGFSYAAMTVSKGAGNSSSIVIGPGGSNLMEFGWDNTNLRSFLNSPGTTPIAFTQNGSNVRLFVNSSGNIGLGTISPTQRLHIAGDNVNTYPILKLQNTQTGGHSWWLYSGALGVAESFGLYDETAGSYRMIFNSNGNLGIGTTSPTAARLVVSGATADASSNNVVADFTSGSANSLIKVTGSGGVTGLGIDGSGDTFLGSLTAGRKLKLLAGNAEGMTILSNGNVGFGNSDPQVKLEVGGNTKITGNMEITGDLVAGNITARYQDVAEWVPSTHAFPAGTVVVLNPNRSNQVMASSEAYDTRVAGVVSERPGLALGEAGKDKVLVATTGRVKVRVDATNAPIHIGDLLVTGEKEGVAMKSEPLLIGGRRLHSPGTLIGKALEPLESGVGEILVLLSLQ